MTETRALITGIGGFVGGHLAEYLLSENVEVHGVVRDGKSAQSLAYLHGRIGLSYADLTNARAVAEVIKNVAPDRIFHLAAQSSPSRSLEDPTGTLVTNLVAQLNVLLGIAEGGLHSRILVPGSNEEYGVVAAEELPITENSPLRPANPYAVSKVAQDMLGYQYFVSHKIDCVRVRPFNHIGPRQTDAYVVSAFARQVAEVEAGLRDPVVKVGNLAVQRDFTDVRDIVRAYHLALEKGQPGEVYNIGTGTPVSVKWILEFLISQSKVRINVEVDPSRFRPVDQPVTVCDSTKFRRATGWAPRIPIEQTLVETLDYWRKTFVQPGGRWDR